MSLAGCSATLPAAAAARPVALPAAPANRTCAGASTSYSQHTAMPSRQGARQQRPASAGAALLGRRAAAATRGALPRFSPAAALPDAFASGEIVEVEDLKGIRVLKNEDDTPRVEYLVKWKDGSPDTWEVAANLADNLLRDYEQRWWGAVKKGDEEAIIKMMEVGGDVLARTVDENRRSAVHFAAAMGKAQLVDRLLKAGGEVDLADKEGYTPLHMAAGYMHTTTIGALLEGGADPEQEDRQGRSPLVLVEGLRAALPPNNPMLVQRRMALENVIQMLTANMFEDVEPMAVLDRRVVYPQDEAEKKDGEEEKKEEEEGEKKEGDEQQKEGEEKEEEAKPKGPARTEWLIKFADEEEPVWVDAKYVSQEVVEDYEAGLEYAQAESVLDMRQRGTMRKYLVRWQDDYPDTWEPEEHVSPDLIALWERQRGLFDASSDSDDASSSDADSGNGSGHGSGRGSSLTAQAAATAAAASGSGSSNGSSAVATAAAQLQGSTAAV